jgi:hypothetical protein
MKRGQAAESATAAVAMLSNINVALRGGELVQSDPAEQARRLRKYSNHPIDTAAAEAIVRGQ